VSDNSSRIRVPMASAKPSVRARRLLSEGSLPAKMLMKTMLSMPRTISSSVSVSSAAQDSAEKRKSKGYCFFLNMSKMPLAASIALEGSFVYCWSVSLAAPLTSGLKEGSDEVPVIEKGIVTSPFWPMALRI
jgi:hypothetical protein